MYTIFYLSPQIIFAVMGYKVNNALQQKSHPRFKRMASCKKENVTIF